MEPIIEKYPRTKKEKIGARLLLLLCITHAVLNYLFLHHIEQSSYPFWWQAYIDFIDKLLPGMQGEYSRTHRFKEGIEACYALGTISFMLTILIFIITTGHLNLIKENIESPLKFYFFTILFLSLLIWNSFFLPVGDPYSSTSQKFSNNTDFFIVCQMQWVMMAAMLYALFQKFIHETKKFLMRE